MNNKAKISDTYHASVGRKVNHGDRAGCLGQYTVICRGADGVEKWQETFPNLLTTAGLKLANDSLLNNTASGAVSLGLKGVGTESTADTQASHATWLELGATNLPTYTVGGSGVRASPSFSAATNATPSIKKTAVDVIFVMTGAGTVAGCFINMGGTTAIDNTTGILFSVGNFAEGSKPVSLADTLSVSYSLALS